MKLQTNISCIYTDLNVYKQMTDVKLWHLLSNTWIPLTVCKKWAQAHLKMLLTKYVYKSHVFTI